MKSFFKKLVDPFDYSITELSHDIESMPSSPQTSYILIGEAQVQNLKIYSGRRTMAQNIIFDVYMKNLIPA
jgi:hypothetical protein